MDPKLYRAAQLGNWDAIKQFESQIYSQQTSQGYNVLHILALFCDSSFAVEQVLIAKPKLLLKSNKSREIALHVAVKKGHSNVVRALIDYAKRHQRCRSLVRCRDEDGNLALHEAVRSNRYGIVQLLVEADPDFSHGQNDAGESPLYVAVEKGYRNIAELILSTCKSPSYGGPNKRTALHAAVIWNFPECMQLILEKLPNVARKVDNYAEYVQLILKKLPNVAKKVDKFGWTALHYAARFNRRELVTQLLLADQSVAYVKCNIYVNEYNNGFLNTALHVAVTHGHIEVVKELLSSCPDCWDSITHFHRNILHLAVENEQNEALDFILNQFWAEDLINQKDSYGNTPLHLYATTKNLLGYNLLNHPKVDINAFNDKGLTPLDIVIGTEEFTERQTCIKNELERAGATPGLRNVISPASDFKEVIRKKEPDLARMAETYLIVCTLIITVTFAAIFTLPGGYNSSEGQGKGTAILAKKTAFIVFIIYDLFAMMTSLEAVIRLFRLQQTASHLTQFYGLDYCRDRIGIAIGAMVVAMLAGLYAVLPTWDIKIFLLVYAAWLFNTLSYLVRIRRFFRSSRKWNYRNRKANFLVYDLGGLYKRWHQVDDH